jgi:hypothetical protein
MIVPVPESNMKRLLSVAAFVACALVGVSEAGAQIVLPGTQPGDIVNWPLLAPSECASCHGTYVAGRDYEPYDSWAGSMMANSARDPLFWAAVDIANQDLPGAGELCIRCHSPKAWLAGRSSTPDGSALTGYPDEPDNDFEGIDCHFCHRMYEGPDGTPFTQNGQYWVDDGTPTQEPTRRGPYAQSFAPHPSERSDYHDSSEFCGACHDLRNPLQNLLDEDGVDTGRLFPEQSTYTEWEQSAFATEGTSCQDCHMPPAEVDPAFACNSFNPPRPAPTPGDDAPVYRHDLTGANTFMLEVLKGEYGAALGRTEELQAGIDRAIASLQGAATLDLQAGMVAVTGDTLDVDVTVTNLTGHKLPTGYPEGRRMWIELVATDVLGAPFFVSGDYDDSTATLVEDPQLRLYETHHGAHGDGPGFHLVLNNRIYSDTRIPPRGFRPDIDTEPLGRTYPVLPDSTLAHWDDASFRIPVPTEIQGPVQIQATLRYQTASREYIEFLRDENASGPDPHDRNYPAAPSRGQKIHDLWTQYGKSQPVDMVSANTVVPVRVPPNAPAALIAVADHEAVHLGWSPLPLGVTEIRLLRTSWGDYPELGSTGSALSAPTEILKYDDALSAGWQPVYTGTGTGVSDSLATGRDLFLYGAWHFDASNVGSTGSFVRGLNYRLGDFGEVGQVGPYDGQITGPEDLPVFSLAWGTSEGDAGFDPIVDIAPTHDGTRHGISEPDDVIDFSDLVIFSLQYGTEPLDPPGSPRTTAATPVISLGRSGNDLLVHAKTNGTALHALALRLPATSGLTVTAASGEAALPAAHFAGARGDAERSEGGFAILGTDQAPTGEGLLLRLTVSGLPRDEMPAILLDLNSWVAVDAAGESLALELQSQLPVPARASQLLLTAPMPNPFNPRTQVELVLPADGRAEVVVFDLAGRRVRTLMNGDIKAGRHPFVWDGLDQRGNAVASGIYLIRAEARGETATRRAVLVR